VSGPEIEHLKNHAGHISVLVHGTPAERRALAQNASSSYLKAVTTLARLALEQGVVPDAHKSKFMSLANRRTPTRDKKAIMLEGRSFGSFFRKVGHGMLQALKFAAPIAMKVLPLIAAL